MQNQKVMLVRFKVPGECQDPIIWPIQYPCWTTGYDSDDNATIVAFVDSEEVLFAQWPELKELGYEVLESNTEVRFTSRFPKPEWYNPE